MSKTNIFITSIMFMLFINSSFAADCLSEICVGAKIIDSRDYVGNVVAIDKQKGEISYKRIGYNSTVNASPTQLSVEIDSNIFPPSKTIIDERNYVGKVLIAFKDGRIQYKRNGYNSKPVSKKLVPAVQSINDISKNSVVIDERNYVGIALNVFKDGRIQYKRNGYNSKPVSKKLVPAVPSLNDISKNIVVIDERDYVGKVLIVFKDGRVQYQRNGYGSTPISTQLVPAVPSLNNISKNTVVIDERNYVGKVLIVFKDGRVQYQRNGYGSTPISRNLSPEVDTHPLYNKHEYYSDEAYKIGKVKTFFANEKVELDYENSSWGATTLFNKVSSLNGYRSHTSIITSQNIFGEISMVFENGAVQFEVEEVVYDKYGEDTGETEMIKQEGRIVSINPEMKENDYNQWLTDIYYYVKDMPTYYSYSTNLVIKEFYYENYKRELKSYLFANEHSFNNEDTSKLLIYLEMH